MLHLALLPPALLLALLLLYWGKGFLAWVLPLAGLFAAWALYHPGAATTPLFLALAIPTLLRPPRNSRPRSARAARGCSG